jgi:hypothetical protein
VVYSVRELPPSPAVDELRSRTDAAKRSKNGERQAKAAPHAVYISLDRSSLSVARGTAHFSDSPTWAPLNTSRS